MISTIFTVLPSIEGSIEWIESHQTTVDLFKWLVVLFLAWIAGGFKYIRNKLRRPTVAIDESASRCFIEEFVEYDGQKDVVRATFLVKLGVLNPTDTRINVKGFGLAIRRARFWNRWKPELDALSLPSRPRFETSTGTKLLKNWFSRFNDDYQDLTLPSLIEPKEFPHGYLLFLSFTPRTMAPMFERGIVRVRARVKLTTGESLTIPAKIEVMTDLEKLESWIPGIKLLISDKSAWHVFTE